MKSASTAELVTPPAEAPARAQAATKAATIPIWARDPWSWLFSLQVGLTLLAALTVASIIGTLIDPLEKAQALVYYTWWFKALLLALAVNMTCATYKTIVTKSIPLSKIRFQKQPNFYSANKPSAAIEYSGTADDAAAALRRAGYKVATDGAYGYARRGLLSRWGSAVSHLGLVMVLGGGFVASWVAKEAIVKVPEGMATDKMWMRTDPPTEMQLGFVLRVDDFHTEFFPRTQMPSKFISTISEINAAGNVGYTGTVEVNNSPVINGWAFHQTSYEELKGAPRYLVAITEGEGSEEAVVELSPGQRRAIPGYAGKEVQLSEGSGSKWRIYEGNNVLAEGSFAGAGGRMQLRADQFEPDFVMGPDKKAGSRSQEYNNPALKVSLLNEAGVVVASQWLFGREDMKSFSHTKMDHYTLEMTGAHPENGAPHLHVSIADETTGMMIGNFELHVGQSVGFGETKTEAAAEAAPAGLQARVIKTVPAYATVLTATRNPLIPFIYVACGLMMLGLVLAFFIRRREVWFWVDSKSNQLRITATYRHSGQEFDPATRNAIASLSAAQANA